MSSGCEVALRMSLMAAAAGCVAAVSLASAQPASSASTPAVPTAMFTYSDPQIDESSGISASSFDDTFYTHNDSGDSARFFRIDAHGNTVATYTLRGAANVDWEDMATGVEAAGNRVLYFADTGDNDHVRKEIAVYEVPEPRGPSADVTWSRYRFTYPDGPHDAEALLVDPRSHRLYIATKELLRDGRIYVAPSKLSKSSVNLLTLVGSDPPLTTSADFAPDGSRVVLLTYLGAYWADDVGAAWHRFDVPLPRQAEAIAYTRDGSSLLVGGEGVHGAIYRAPVPTAAPAPKTAPKSASQESSSQSNPSAASPSPSQAAANPGQSSGPPIGAVILIVVAAVVVAAIFVVRVRRNR